MASIDRLMDLHLFQVQMTHNLVRKSALQCRKNGESSSLGYSYLPLYLACYITSARCIPTTRGCKAVRTMCNTPTSFQGEHLCRSLYVYLLNSSHQEWYNFGLLWRLMKSGTQQHIWNSITVALVGLTGSTEHTQPTVLLCMKKHSGFRFRIVAFLHVHGEVRRFLSHSHPVLVQLLHSHFIFTLLS